MSLLLDISGLEALFSLHYKALCTTSFRIVEDRGIAEDIVQGVFQKLWDMRSSWNAKISIKTYLFETTIDNSLAYVKCYRSYLSEDVLMYDGSDEGEDAACRKEVRLRVEEAVRTLPDICRLIFILNRYERLNFKDTAAKLGISVVTVEKQIAMATRHFYKRL